MARTLARRITVAILLLGLAVAAAVFIATPPDVVNPDSYDPLTNKKYIRELQMYGGRANVFSAELMEWFDSLWHGRRLAYTIAALSIVTASAFWFFATLPKLEQDPFDPAKSGTTRNSKS